MEHACTRARNFDSAEKEKKICLNSYLHEYQQISIVLIRPRLNSKLKMTLKIIIIIKSLKQYDKITKDLY